MGKGNPLYIKNILRAPNQFFFYVLLPKKAERQALEETGHTGNPAALCRSKNCRMEMKKCLYQESKGFPDVVAGATSRFNLVKSVFG